VSTNQLHTLRFQKIPEKIKNNIFLNTITTKITFLISTAAI